MSTAPEAPYPSSPSGPSRAVSLSIAAGLVLVWAFVRLVVFDTLIFPLTYALPLLVCVWTRDRVALWAMAFVFAALHVTELFWVLPEGVLAPGELQADLVATMVSIVTVAAAVELILRLRERLEWAVRQTQQQAERLRQQSEELAAQNDELTRQAEELSQQAEELARQAEELVAHNEELRAQTDEIKALFRRVVAVQEEERLRIARDLHDQLGQQMTALRMNLNALTSRIEHDQALSALATRTQGIAEDLDRSIDFLTWDLRPAALEELGLAAALRHLVNGWSEHFGIVAEFGALGMEALTLSSDVESNMYRLAQEALHNVVKHAHATHVAASLQTRKGEVVLIIEDNGRGFVVGDSRAGSGGGLGLVSMKERAALVGGTIDIESAPGRGTTVFVRVPIPAAGRSASARI